MITSPGDNFTEVYDVIEDLSLGQVVEFVVNDLFPDTTYFVFVYAVNTVGRGQDSERKNFTTAAITPAAIVITTAATPVPAWIIVLSFLWSLVIVSGVLFIIAFVWYSKTK